MTYRHTVHLHAGAESEERNSSLQLQGKCTNTEVIDDTISVITDRWKDLDSCEIIET